MRAIDYIIVFKHVVYFAILFFPAVNVFAQLDSQAEQRYVKAGLEFLQAEKYDSAIIQFNQLYHPDATSGQKAKAKGYVMLCECLKAELAGDYERSWSLLKEVSNVDWSLVRIKGVDSYDDLKRRILRNEITQQLKEKETLQIKDTIFNSNNNQVGDTSVRPLYLSIISSMLLPGLGQMEQGHKTEGVVTFAGEVVLIGGAVTTYFLGKNKLDEIKGGITDYSEYEKACKMYSELSMTNRVLWIASAALYVFNIVRSATMQPLDHNEVSFQSSVAYVADRPLPTIGLTYRF